MKSAASLAKHGWTQADSNQWNQMDFGDSAKLFKNMEFTLTHLSRAASMQFRPIAGIMKLAVSACPARPDFRLKSI
jgi:hypothetical protein